MRSKSTSDRARKSRIPAAARTFMCLSMLFLPVLAVWSAQPKVRIAASTAGGAAARQHPADSSVAAGRMSLLRNPTFWPPRLQRFYPDMELRSQDNRLVRLSDYRGKVIIIEPIALDCPVSQAYSGANRPGVNPFGVCFPNTRVKSFAELMRNFTGYSIDTPGLIFVQIIVSTGEDRPPTVADARAWAEHFGLKTAENKYVLVASEDMIGKYKQKTRLMVPGFQLIDRAFVLRCDSTGPLPKEDLYNRFFPMLRSMFY